jgi:hypothetical protein
MIIALARLSQRASQSLTRQFRGIELRWSPLDLRLLAEGSHKYEKFSWSCHPQMRCVGIFECVRTHLYESELRATQKLCVARPKGIYHRATECVSREYSEDPTSESQ